MQRNTQPSGGVKPVATLFVFSRVSAISPRRRWVIANVYGGGGFRLTGQLIDNERFLWVCNVPVDRPRTWDGMK